MSANSANRIGALIGLACGLCLCWVIFGPLFVSIHDANEYAKVESTAYAREIATAEAQATLVPIDVDYGFNRFLEVVEAGEVYKVGTDKLPYGIIAEASSGTTEFVEGPVAYEAIEISINGSDISAYQWFDQCNVDVPGVGYVGTEDEDGDCSIVVSGPGWTIGIHVSGKDWEIAVPYR